MTFLSLQKANRLSWLVCAGLVGVALVLLYNSPLASYLGRPAELSLVLLCFYGMGGCLETGHNTASPLDAGVTVIVSLAVCALPYVVHKMVINVQTQGSFSVVDPLDAIVPWVIALAALTVPMYLGAYTRRQFQRR